MTIALNISRLASSLNFLLPPVETLVHPKCATDCLYMMFTRYVIWMETVWGRGHERLGENGKGRKEKATKRRTRLLCMNADCQEEHLESLQTQCYFIFVTTDVNGPLFFRAQCARYYSEDNLTSTHVRAGPTPCRMEFMSNTTYRKNTYSEEPVLLISCVRRRSPCELCHFSHMYYLRTPVILRYKTQ